MDALRDSGSDDINTRDTSHNGVSICCVSSYIDCLCCVVLQSAAFHIYLAGVSRQLLVTLVEANQSLCLIDLPS